MESLYIHQICYPERINFRENNFPREKLPRERIPRRRNSEEKNSRGEKLPRRKTSEDSEVCILGSLSVQGQYCTVPYYTVLYDTILCCTEPGSCVATEFAKPYRNTCRC